MDNNSDPKDLSELVEPGSTLMVTFPNSDHADARPLTAGRISGDRVEMLVDGRRPWAAVTPGTRVHATLSDNRSNVWATMSGSASISTDPQLIDELWNPAASAYFDDGRDSDGLAVLQISVEEGRYWSSPSGRIGSLISMAKAALGDGEDGGEHGAIDV